MGNFLMDEEVDELGEIGPALDNLKVSHFRVNELPRDGVEIDLDGAETVRIVDIIGLHRNYNYFVDNAVSPAADLFRDLIVIVFQVAEIGVYFVVFVVLRHLVLLRVRRLLV